MVKFVWWLANRDPATREIPSAELKARAQEILAEIEREDKPRAVGR
jgi:hypothetical protein